MTTELTFTHRTGIAVRTVPEAFQQTLRPAQVALRTVGGGVEITWAEYGRRVRAIAAGIAKLGMRHGDTVGMMRTNRPEFHLADTAALHLGATRSRCTTPALPSRSRTCSPMRATGS